MESRRNRRLGLVAVALVVVALTGVALTQVGISATGQPPGDRPVVVTVSPTRVLDTRPAPYGPIGVPEPAPLGPRETLILHIAGTATIPADASGVVVNVTAVNATAESFVTIYPATLNTRPGVSTLNPSPGRTTFNAAIIDLPGSATDTLQTTPQTGELAIYNNAGTVDLVIDVTGYTVHHDHDDVYGVWPVQRTRTVEGWPAGETKWFRVGCPAFTSPREAYQFAPFEAVGGGASARIGGDLSGELALVADRPIPADRTVVGVPEPGAWEVGYRNISGAAIAQVEVEVTGSCVRGESVQR